MNKRTHLRPAALLLALLALLHDTGTPSDAAARGMGNDVLLALKISQARMQSRRVLYYRSVTRQHKKRRAGKAGRPRESAETQSGKRPIDVRPPPKGR